MVVFEMVAAGVGGLAIYTGYLLVSRMLVQIPEGAEGILTCFGKAELLDDEAKTPRTLGAGLHFILPWKVVRVINGMEQIIDLSGDEGGIQAMASDGTMLRLDTQLRIMPDRNKYYKFLFSMARPVDHVKGLFGALLRTEIGKFDLIEAEFERVDGAVGHISGLQELPQKGSYALLRNEHKRLNTKILGICRAEIGRRYGVVFHGVDVTDILPPDELAAALNGVINAQSEAKRLYSQTEADCEQRVISAEKGLDIAKTRAMAVETEIMTMAAILANLQRSATLMLYVARRRFEVLADSKTAYFRSSK